jgi:nitrogen fixation/metabolism regulation signal transduction histidine kinase
MGEARRKKSYLLNPRFQLKWTGYLVVVVVLVMASLGVIIARTAGRASDTASLAVTEAEKAFEESRSNNILARRTVQLAGGENAALQSIMDESLAEVDAQSAKNLADVRSRQTEIAKYRQHIQLLLIGAGLALLVVLMLMGVVITHRIVGPVHKMKRLLRRVSTGRLVIEERLRRGDELEDLFDTFLQMTYSLRAMQAARLATLDGTLKQAEVTATPAAVLEGLRALRAQLVLGLEPRRPSMRPPPSSSAGE